ncbi:MAG: hypothetical protein JF887_12630 [Candidatus Dormibacteraeota bacterium]|uniref:DoxX family protein n=1 Tax=Candidatus Amunia macphersoniae TaxID=3127014 RepID=A0A934KGP5_9BACT|nr:hypothetical protein [Candidatus Dormibacteraeota bacterium]
MTVRRRLSLYGLSVLIGGSGLLHLLMPAPYRRIVPAPLSSWRAEVVIVSGLAEIVCACLLLLPRTRRLGAIATVVLLVAVFPANLQMALDGGYSDAGFPANSAAAAWLRLPLQLPLILWALSFRLQPETEKASHLEATGRGRG